MEKRLIPEVRFKGFKGNWEEKKLGSLALFKRGKGYSKNDLKENGTPIILYGRLYTNYETIISEVETYVEEKPNSLKSIGGEVIVPASGESPIEIAIASVVKKSGFILGGDLNVIYPNENLKSLFLTLSITNGNNKKQIARKAQGATITHIGNNDLKKLIINFPEIDEQEKIGRLFEKLDQTIELQGKVVEENKRLKGALLQKLFPKKGQKLPDLRLKSFSGDWEEKKYKELGKILNGFAFKSEDFGLGNIKIIRISNLLSDGFVGGEFVTYKEDDNLKKFIVRDGEILIAMSGATTGKLAINKSDAYLNQRVGAFKPSKNLDNYFLKSYLDRNEFYYFISSNWVAGAQPNISVKQIGEYDMMIPSLPEQEAIGNLFRSLDEKIKREEERLEGYKTLKKSLLQKMFV